VRWRETPEERQRDVYLFPEKVLDHHPDPARRPHSRRNTTEVLGAFATRAGLATSVPEALGTKVQRQMGHATPQMTQRYRRRRERWDVNFTKAAGL
jgi:integrase